MFVFGFQSLGKDKAFAAQSDAHLLKGEPYCVQLRWMYKGLQPFTESLSRNTPFKLQSFAKDLI